MQLITSFDRAPTRFHFYGSSGDAKLLSSCQLYLSSLNIRDPETSRADFLFKYRYDRIELHRQNMPHNGRPTISTLLDRQ